MKLSIFDESDFDVDFMSCVVDKADNLKVIESDSHFTDFVGIHPSKIKQGKLFLHNVISQQDRQNVMEHICKKNAQYAYLDFEIKGKDDEYIFVHCIGENEKDSTLCRLTMADVSTPRQKQNLLRQKAIEMNQLIDLVTGGVCLFKVTQDMHIEAIYLNQACCKIFATTKSIVSKRKYRLDDFIYPEDKSAVFQQIGNCMATGEPIDMQIRIVPHKDKFIWCKLNSAIQRYDEDKCPIFHAMITDITGIKEAQAEANKQKEIMVQLFKNLPGPIFCTDLDYPLQPGVVSSDFLKLLGYTRSEFFDKYDGNLGNLMTKRDIDIATHKIFSQSQNNKEVQVEYSVKSKGGKILVVKDRRKIIEQSNGEKSTVGMLTDRTSRHMGDDIDI